MIVKHIAIGIIGCTVLTPLSIAVAKESFLSELRNAVSTKAQTAPSSSQIDYAFSPDEGAEELIVKAISTAKTSIRLAAYSFTSKPIIQALMAAKKRGVDVQCVLDKSNIKSKSGIAGANLLANAGIPTRIDSQHPIYHNKFIVIDSAHLETGSFNYSAAAAHKNAENAIVIWRNPQLAKGYTNNWTLHWEHSDVYKSGY